MSTSFYVYETQYKHARRCDQCSGGMNEGYLYEEAALTYCSTECVSEANQHQQIVINELIGSGRMFWTSWHDEVEGLE